MDEWTEHVHDVGKGLLSNEVDSWMTGVNKNVAGKQKRIIARYSGSAPLFRSKCKAVSDAHYDAFVLKSSRSAKVAPSEQELVSRL